MKIITIPHPTLRKKSQAITKVDDKLIRFINELEQTLDNSRNPRGVGLAAPQVDTLMRAFTTNLPDDNKKNSSPGLNHFINPVIIKACKRKKVLGVNPKDPDLEGCLSIPHLYGPVPRHRWVELEYQTLKEGKLINHQQRFDNFAARVIQHELDHLDGILFTDHSLEYDLPVYRQENEQMVEIDKKLIEII